MIYYIYEVQFLKTGKTYVGQRQCPINKTPETDTYMGSGKVIRDYFAKHHNYDEWTKSILQVCNSKEEVDKAEIFWIAKRKNEGKAEYNFALGGDGNPLAYYDEETEKVIRKKAREKASETVKNWSEEKRKEIREKKQTAWKIKKERDDYWMYTEKQSKSHKGKKYKSSYADALTEEELKLRSQHVKATWAAKTKEELEQKEQKRQHSIAQWSEEKKKEVFKSYGSPGEKNPIYGKVWWNNGEKNLPLPKGVNPPPGYKKGLLIKNKRKDAGLKWITDGKSNKRINKNDPIPEGWKKGRTKGV